MKKIVQLQERLRRTNAALIKVLEKEYPEGWRVRFEIQSGQVTPSRGEIIGHEGGEYAYLKVRLECRTKLVRSISVDRIIGRPERPSEAVA